MLHIQRIYMQDFHSKALGAPGTIFYIYFSKSKNEVSLVASDFDSLPQGVFSSADKKEYIISFQK